MRLPLLLSCGCVAGGLAVAKGNAAPSSAPIGCLPVDMRNVAAAAAALLLSVVSSVAFFDISLHCE